MNSKIQCKQLMICVATMTCLITAALSHADTVKVFLLAGQSNMVGQAREKDLPEHLKQPQNDVLFFYNYKNTSSGVVPLAPGSGNQFGPELTFGRTLADTLPAEKYAIIKFAVNGSNLFNHWKPVNDNRGVYYKRFQVVVQEGLDALKAAGHTPQIVGMLWTQGEADGLANRTTEQYQQDLTEFIADVRNRYGKDLPFLFNRLAEGQRQLSDEQRQSIRAAQEAVAAADPNAWLIETDGLKQTDTVHFNAEGQIELGTRFAKTWLDHAKGSPQKDNE